LEGSELKAKVIDNCLVINFVSEPIQRIKKDMNLKKLMRNFVIKLILKIIEEKDGNFKALIESGQKFRI